MGLFSNLFGGDKRVKVIREIIAMIAEIQGLSSGYESAGFMRLAINDLLRIYLSSREDVDRIIEDEI